MMMTTVHRCAYQDDLSDSQFLDWIATRLSLTHGDRPDMAYVLRLRLMATIERRREQARADDGHPQGE
jgi:hypothetical protein